MSQFVPYLTIPEGGKRMKIFHFIGARDGSDMSIYLILWYKLLPQVKIHTFCFWACDFYKLILILSRDWRYAGPFKIFNLHETGHNHEHDHNHDHDHAIMTMNRTNTRTISRAQPSWASLTMTIPRQVGEAGLGPLVLPSPAPGVILIEVSRILDDGSPWSQLFWYH